MDDKPLLDEEDENISQEEPIRHPLQLSKQEEQKDQQREEDVEEESQQQQKQAQQQQQPIQQPMQPGQLLNQQQIMQLIQTLQSMTPPQRQQFMQKYPPQIQQQVMMAWQQMAMQQQQQQQRLQQQGLQQQPQQQQIPQQFQQEHQVQPIPFPSQNQQKPAQQQEQTEAQKLQQLQQQLHKNHKKVNDPYSDMEKNFQQPGGCYASCLACCGDNCGSILCLIFDYFFFNLLIEYICCCCFNPRVEIQTQTEGLVSRFGRFHSVLGPGLHFVNPCTDEVQQIDLKKQTLNLPKQIALTKDNITMSIDASINYFIINSRIATYGVYSISDAIALFAKATLRNICGQMELQELLEKKNEIKIEMMKIIDEHVYIWGVEIENIFIKDMVVSGSVMQDAVAIATQNRRYAETKVISAQADVETAKMQQKAADELSSDAAMQIRYLQILERIAVSSGTRIVFYPKSYKKQVKAAYEASQF